MLDLDLMASTTPLYHPLWCSVTSSAANALFRMPRRTRFRVEGLENFPDRPAIVSPNHTHKFDFLPIRLALLEHDVRLMTWIKARDYNSALMRTFFAVNGNIPLASRGYVIAADFAATMGRRPSEDEYRSLRDHVDHDTDLEPSLLQELEGKPRSILGVDADPASIGYAAAIRLTYYRLMQETLRHAETGRAAGHHQHIYPQGSTSGQLTPGRIGAVQAALALELPIVPVGISGCREVFRGDTPVSSGGEIVIRLGEPMNMPADLVPSTFRPFHPADEREHRPVLQEQTDELMERINALCEPAYRWAADGRSDAKRGVARFYS